MDVDQNSTDALNQIESEIREIDQMIHSWSSGRSLRFDPAHVIPANRQDLTPAKTNKREKKNTIGRIFFWFNLLAFLLPIGLLAFQSFAKSLSPRVESLILTISLMILAGGNLALAAFEYSRIKTHSIEKRTNVRNNRNQTSIRSNT